MGCSHGSELTWEQLAMVLVGRPMEGAQATSRTQSLCASNFCSSFHWPSSSSLIEEIGGKSGSSPGAIPMLLFLPHSVGSKGLSNYPIFLISFVEPVEFYPVH